MNKDYLQLFSSGMEANPIGNFIVPARKLLNSIFNIDYHLATII